MTSERARKEYERRINKAIDFIGVHLTENPSLDDIAQAANFSKFHFHRLFQAHVGETVLEFTRRLRLEKAASLLHFDRDKDITSIALDCGFSSSQNFAKAFRKHFGMSPTDYRGSDGYANGPAVRKNGNTLRKSGNTDGKDGNANTAPNDHSHDGLTMNRIDEKEKTVTIEVKEIEPLNVAYVRTIGEYGFEPASKAFQKLEQWAGPRGHMNDAVILGVTWDNPCVTPADKCRYDACVVVPEDADISGGADQQQVAGGTYAVHRTEVFNHDFQKGWDALVKDWLPSSGYQPGDGPAFEVYVEKGGPDPQARWQVDIHLPVKPL